MRQKSNSDRTVAESNATVKTPFTNPTNRHRLFRFAGCTIAAPASPLTNVWPRPDRRRCKHEFEELEGERRHCGV